MKNQVGVALNPMGYPHYTDHLAAVAVTMNIPLVFTDIYDYEQAERLYPNLEVQLKDWQEFNARYIVENYDVVFVSDMWNRHQLKAKFHICEQELKKSLRVVHCPHGFSDKGFWFEECLEQDITLVYGQNMLDLIQQRSSETKLQNYIQVGNLRRNYYLKHQQHFDRVVQEDVFRRFAKKQPTILYAPTWRDSENSTTFFEAAKSILSHLPKQYNLLLKLHPNLEHDHDRMIEVYEIISKYENEPNIVMLTGYPLIYPLAAACDIYIGDRSAVGYDWLTFKKPMFFLSNEKENPYLYRCGTVIPLSQLNVIYSIIEDSLPFDEARYSAIRSEVNDYTFGETRNAEAIRNEIATLATQPRAD